MLKQIKENVGDCSFLLDVKIMGGKAHYNIVSKSNFKDVHFGPATSRIDEIDEADDNIIQVVTNLINDNKSQIDLIDSLSKNKRTADAEILSEKVKEPVQETEKAAPPEAVKVEESTPAPTTVKPKRTLFL